MMETAVQHHGPVAIRYPRGKAQGVEIEDQPQPIPMGKAEILKPGDDVLIIALGSSVAEAQLATQELESQGIDAEIINARFAKPLDQELILREVKRVKKVVTVEEHVLAGGFGAGVAELLMDNGVTNLEFKRLGIQDQLVEHGTQTELRRDHGIDAQGIIQAVKELHGR